MASHFWLWWCRRSCPCGGEAGGGAHPKRVSPSDVWGRSNRQQLEATWAPLVDAAGSLVVDLGGATFLDAVAVGILLSLMGERSARGLQCECQAASIALGRVLGWPGAAHLAPG